MSDFSSLLYCFVSHLRQATLTKKGELGKRGSYVMSKSLCGGYSPASAPQVMIIFLIKFIWFSLVPLKSSVLAASCA